MEESDLLMKLESLELKRQVEVLSTFLPNEILKSLDNFETTQTFNGVLLYIEVSGLTSLYERYHKVGEGGICPLTATLNAHAGIIMEIINFYEGDLIKYTGDEFLAYWKAESKLEETIHNVIVCSLFMHDNYGCFETEVNVPLKLKLVVCFGEVQLHAFGVNSKRMAVLGPAVENVKFAKAISSSGDVIVSPEAWKHLRPENYEAMKPNEGFVKVWNCVYNQEDDSKTLKNEYEQKENILVKLCSKHLAHRQNLHKKQCFSDTTTQLEMTESFMRSLPARSSINMAVKRWKTYDLKPFTHKMVQNQIDERQAVEDLTEVREVTVEYIRLELIKNDVRVVAAKLQKLCAAIEDTIAQRFGIINDVSLLNRVIAVTIVFGLRRHKHELESKNALECAFTVNQIIRSTERNKSISIGISTGLIYTGIVGHPLRRDFIIIGRAVNRAERLTSVFQNKITCDYKTYRSSKLSSRYFHLLCVPDMKGILSGNIFEYNENFQAMSIKVERLRIVGREDERDLIWKVINHPDKINYYGICLHGQDEIGKSTLLRSSMLECQKEDCAFVSIELCRNTQRPYFCISNLYKQLYNQRSKANSEEFVLIKDLPSDLWDFSDVLQRTPDVTNTIRIQRKFKMLNMFREITKNSKLGFAIIFIDNIQYIDAHSLDILETVVKEKCIRLVCAGQFEEDFWDVRWKMSLNNYIKLLELSPLKFEHLLRFVCNSLKVQGVHVRLMRVLKNYCDSIPGLMEEFLCKLLDEGHMQTLYMSKSMNYKEFVFLNMHEIKRQSKQVTGRKLVCKLSDNFTCEEKISASVLSAHTLESYNSFHLDLLKVSSALGEIFSRSLLSMIFKYSSKYVFADAVKNLFHQEVFECATRYLSSINLVAAPNFCQCHCVIDENERKQTKAFLRLPKYAFCKLLRFRNKTIREMAYDKLDEEEKRKLNLKVTDILEVQNNSCENCLRNNSAPIVLVPKFREVFLRCKVRTEMKCDGSRSASKESDDIENVISKCVKPTSHGKKEAAGLKRNIWDSSICYCLEILIKVYQDLVYHSKEAGHVEKVIFFLVQNAKITMLMNEFQDAIPILEEAMELCRNYTNTSDVVIPQTFRSIHEAKINALLAEIYLNLGITIESRRYLLESFKQYQISLTPYNVCTRFFGIPIFKNANNNIKSKSIVFRSDFGACLNLASSLFAVEGDWNLAKIASTQCINFISNDFVSLNLLCDIYSNAIGVYNYCGETARCEKLEKYVSQYVLKKFSSNVTLDLFSVSKLIFAVFQMRFLNAKLETAIRLGYRAIDLNNNIQANYVLIDVVTTLSSALLLVKRLEDSVEVTKLLYNIGKIKQDYALLAYYTSNLELVLETSFTMEPIQKALDFAEDYIKILNRKELTALEKSLLILTYVYHLRNNRWVDTHKWKAIVNFGEFPCTSVQTAKNLFKYTEALMIFFAKNDVSKSYNSNMNLKDIKKYLKQCKVVSKKWQVFRPRYFHYKAYYCKLTDRKALVKKYLKQANAIAEEQGNILERCWVMQSENFWDGGFSFEGVRNYIDWKQVKSYSPLHWSQVLYGLPWHP